MPMMIDAEEFHESVATLENRFTDATNALAKGDTAGLKKALTAIVKVVNVLLTVLSALDAAKGKK